MKRICGLLLATSLLTACVDQPVFTTADQPVPQAWQTQAPQAGDSVLQAAWWQKLNDPVLNDLVAKAIKNNQDIKLAAIRVRTARADLLSTQAGFLPQVNLNTVYQRAKTSEYFYGNSGGFGNAIGQARNLYTVNLDASWEFNIFQVDPALKAAEEQIKFQEEAQRSVLVSVLGEVARNYIELRRLQASIATTDDVIGALQSTVNLTTARQTAGLSSGLDVARTQADLDTSRATRPALEAAQIATTHRLEVLLGGLPGTLAQLTINKADIPQVPSGFTLTAPASVVAARPDIRAAAHALASATQVQQVAAAQYYPKISLPLAFGWQSFRTGNLFNTAAQSWSFGGGLVAPLVDFGRIRADIDVSDANAEAAFLTYQHTVIGALADVETALSDHLASINRYETLVKAASARQQSLTLVQAKYKSGLSSYLEVSDATRTYATGQLDVIQAQADVANTLVTLYKAVGGGWQGVLPEAQAAAPQTIGTVADAPPPKSVILPTAGVAVAASPEVIQENKNGDIVTVIH